MNATDPDFAALRRAMVKLQIAGRGIRDGRVLEAMARVPKAGPEGASGTQHSRVGCVEKGAGAQQDQAPGWSGHGRTCRLVHSYLLWQCYLYADVFTVDHD